MLSNLSFSIDSLFVAFAVAAASLFFSFVCSRIVRAIADRLLPSWSVVLGSIVQFGIILIGLALIIQYTGVISAAVLLTVLTLFTAGASLSASNLIGNALATLQILVFGYYRKGDMVTIAGDVYGKIIEVNAFSTVLKTRSRDRLVVNNSTVVSETIRVHTGYTGREIEVHVPVCAKHDRKLVVQLLMMVGRNYTFRLEGEEMEPMVFHEYGSSSENYKLVVFVDDHEDIRVHYTNISIAAGNMLNDYGVDVGETNDNRNEISGTLQILRHRHTPEQEENHETENQYVQSAANVSALLEDRAIEGNHRQVLE